MGLWGGHYHREHPQQKPTDRVNNSFMMLDAEHEPTYPIDPGQTLADRLAMESYAPDRLELAD